MRTEEDEQHQQLETHRHLQLQRRLEALAFVEVYIRCQCDARQTADQLDMRVDQVRARLRQPMVANQLSAACAEAAAGTAISASRIMGQLMIRMRETDDDRMALEYGKTLFQMLDSARQAPSAAVEDGGAFSAINITYVEAEPVEE